MSSRDNFIPEAPQAADVENGPENPHQEEPAKPRAFLGWFFIGWLIMSSLFLAKFSHTAITTAIEIVTLVSYPICCIQILEETVKVFPDSVDNDAKFYLIIFAGSTMYVYNFYYFLVLIISKLRKT